MTLSKSYDPRQYWENRLNADFTLKAAGLRNRGMALNEWIYQAKLRALEHALVQHQIRPHEAAICEIGCGTGFYFPFWLKYQPRDLVGWDITTTSIEHLRQRFPQATVECRDIGQPLVGYDGPGFDLVTAFDVLFHVTRPAAFQQALDNLSAITRSGGYVLITDYFWKYGTIKTKPHVRYRSLAEYDAGLGRVGLRIEGLYPQTFLMNAPIDIRHPFKRYAMFLSWTVVSYLGRIESIGDWLGRWAYRKEANIMRHQRETPSSKILVCRRS